MVPLIQRRLILLIHWLNSVLLSLFSVSSLLIYASPQCGQVYTIVLNMWFGPSPFRCESVGLELMKPGTDSTDSECGDHGEDTRVVKGTLFIVLIIVPLCIGYFLFCCCLEITDNS